MDTLLYNNELQLGRFAEYLLKQKLVPERNAPYYVSWVRKFLARGVPVPVVPLDERVAGFLQELEAAGNYQTWQITQAERALRLFFVNFKGDTTWSAPTVATVTANPDGSYGRNNIMEALRTLLRVKHYAYSTEKTYLDWVGRFFDYVKETGHGTVGDGCQLNTERVRDFLAYLATRREVAASTQNQAFNAILFLFREVLRIDMGEMEQGVRAKRGPNTCFRAINCQPIPEAAKFAATTSATW